MRTDRPVARLFGFRFSLTRDVATVARDIMRDSAVPGVRRLITPNASQIVYYNEARHRTLKAFYANGDYVLPDGMPIVWLGRLKGIRALHRLPGSDLFPELWQLIRREQRVSVFVLASEEMEHKFRAEHPECHFIVPRMFDVDDNGYIGDLADAVVEAVREKNAQFIFLGLGFPKQEKLGLRITEALRDDTTHSVLLLLLGASFEFYFGLKPRAPYWMQRYGLEWLHRFMQEPARLWKRYTVDNVRFLWLALRELFIFGKAER